MLSTRHILHVLGGLGATGLGAAALWLHGPSPVVHVSYAIDHQASFLYMVSAFPFFGILCGEALHRFRQDQRAGWRLGVQLAALCLLALGRLAWHLPLSGHFLLQVFFLAEASRLGDGRARQAYLLSGGLVLGALLWAKVVMWQDGVTPCLGAAAGLLVWVAGDEAKP